MVVEPLAALLELLLDVADRELEFAARRDVVAGREDLHLVARAQDLAGHAIQLLDALDLISEELDPVDLLLAGGHDVDNIAAHAKAQPSQVVVVALVEHLGELAQQDLAPDRLARDQLDRLAHVILDRADAIDAADAGHHDHVTPRHQRGGGAVTHAVDLLVARGVLLDVGIRARDVGLGLVVVVVADEILDSVAGEEPLELGAQLRRQRFVGAHHQRRPAQLLDHPAHDVGLAGPGDAHQHLLAEALVESL